MSHCSSSSLELGQDLLQQLIVSTGRHQLARLRRGAAVEFRGGKRQVIAPPDQVREIVLMDVAADDGPEESDPPIDGGQELHEAQHHQGLAAA
jgi:hypothetical protein